MPKRIPILFAAGLVLLCAGGAARAWTKVNNYHGTSCFPDPQAPSSHDAPSYDPLLGVSTGNVNHSNFFFCPVSVDPTLGVGLMEFWAYDRHSTLDVGCRVTLLDYAGHAIASATPGTSGSNSNQMFFTTSFGGVVAASMSVLCSVPGDSSGNRSFLTTFHFFQ
jgi:hypothetical protein